MASQASSTVADAPFQLTRANCAQCGSELRYVPFKLENFMCRVCYGSDRYKKGGPPNGKTNSYNPMEITQTDREAAAPTMAADSN